jgi:hypothetical protein
VEIHESELKNIRTDKTWNEKDRPRRKKMAKFVNEKGRGREVVFHMFHGAGNAESSSGL